ncbi:hypothetical protein EYC84_005375 [Monilinia fructicola]|uniref:Uncharacterized protein n=1 Tax=Monilinia fructicola TaxID=38448 RepID=A0A5M9K053_MONFR|nr:hypothetical protein EYC84_005375 [Monilinia fructicola]
MRHLARNIPLPSSFNVPAAIYAGIQNTTLVHVPLNMTASSASHAHPHPHDRTNLESRKGASRRTSDLSRRRQFPTHAIALHGLRTHHAGAGIDPSARARIRRSKRQTPRGYPSIRRRGCPSRASAAPPPARPDSCRSPRPRRRRRTCLGPGRRSGCGAFARC